MLRESDIYNFVFALVSMGITMLWRKKPENKPNSDLSASEDNAQYRWNDREWRIPPYKHWEAGNSDYQSDERRYWRRQVWAMWVSLAIGVATLIAAVAAARIAYWAYEATSAAVVEAQKQTTEAQRQTKIASEGRAYILFDIIPPKFPSNLVRAETIVNQTITFKFTNYGKSPAVIKYIGHRTIIIDMASDSFQRHRPLLLSDEVFPGDYIIRADDSTKEFTERIVTLNIAERMQIQMGQKQIWFSGIVRYLSVQGQSFETAFCFVVKFPFGNLTEQNDPKCNYRT